MTKGRLRREDMGVSEDRGTPGIYANSKVIVGELIPLNPKL